MPTSTDTFFTDFEMEHDREFVTRITIFSSRWMFRVFHTIRVYYADIHHTVTVTRVAEFAINTKKANRNMLDTMLRDVKARKFRFKSLNADLFFNHKFTPNHDYDPEDAFYYGEG